MSTDPTLKFVREDFTSLPQYSPIQPLDVIAKEIGVPVDRLAKLDANENLYGPMPEVSRALENLEGMHIYPDPAQTYLRQDLAKYVGFTPEHVVAGVGSDELLDLVMRLVDPVEGIVTASPTFGMYSFLGKIGKCKIIDVARLPAPLFELDINGVEDAIDAGAKLVFVASPNNPTGGLVSLEHVERMCAKKCVVVIDEAYAEFSGGSALPLLDKYPNLIVMRTFSKWAGLAGMRVGFAIAHPKMIEKIMGIKQPYNICVAAEAAARAALAVKDKIHKQHIIPILQERERMLIALQEFQWLMPMPSVANFVLYKVLSPMSASDIYTGLRRLGVLVRYYPQGPLAGYIRISCGRPRDTELLVEGLRKLNESENSPQAVILDMDGVLAEVSRSYRVAIINTCAAYGVQVSSEDIHEAKLKGNANDDWKLSLSFIAAKLSSPPSLDQVIATFQGFYLGTNDQVGLRELESLICSRALLVELRKRCPLGMAIVTGRPREECLHFLDMHNLRSLVSDGTGAPVVVCMHEAPSKPSPEPVLLALKRLGIVDPSQAIMVGDTPDDMRAAVAAGVGAYAVLTPETKDVETVTQTLIIAGAIKVMQPGFVELLDLFPAASSSVNVTRQLQGCVTPTSRCTDSRSASISRVTGETTIHVSVNIDGSGISTVHTGLGFLDHMINALAKHSRFDIEVECKGDLWVDDHHTSEDVGIALGEALDTAMGSRSGIARWGYALCPLDEALSRAVVDISSRPWAIINLGLKREMIGNISCEMIGHFIHSFSTAARLTVHVECLSGENDHHRSESAFKALAVALKMALAYDSSAGVPSTKGFLQ